MIHHIKPQTPQLILTDQVNHREKDRDKLTPLATLLVTYFNCAYYTLQCPFRLEYNYSSGLIITKANSSLRMVYVVVATAAGFILVYDSIIKGSSTFSWMPASSEGSMKIIFDFIINFAWSLSNFLAKWELWCAPGRIEQILMLLLRLEKQLRIGKLNYFGALKHPTFIGMFIYTQMTAFSLWEVSTALWSGNGTSVFDAGDSTYQIALQSAAVASTFYENQVLQVSSKLVPLIALVFVSIAYSLNSNVEDYDETAERLVLVNEISMRMKMCFGMTIAASCFCQLPYDAQYLQQLFESSWSYQCQYSYYFSLLLVQLWLGSEAHSKLSSINHLTATTQAPGFSQDAIIPINEGTRVRNRRALLTDAYNQNSIGVRGHLMTFTYAFFGNITVWMLAYAITFIQFQSMQKPCMSPVLIHA